MSNNAEEMKAWEVNDSDEVDLGFSQSQPQPSPSMPTTSMFTSRPTRRTQPTQRYILGVSTTFLIFSFLHLTNRLTNRKA